MGQAQTGTGKRQFGLPILKRSARQERAAGAGALPTRELAIQVSEELSKLAVHKRGVSVLGPITAGSPLSGSFGRACQGRTGGRGHAGPGYRSFAARHAAPESEARIVVLDEADEMLDMGFREDIELILEQSPADCQRVLFSATMPQPSRTEQAFPARAGRC